MVWYVGWSKELILALLVVCGLVIPFIEVIYPRLIKLKQNKKQEG